MKTVDEIDVSDLMAEIKVKLILAKLDGGASEFKNGDLAIWTWSSPTRVNISWFTRHGSPVRSAQKKLWPWTARDVHDEADRLVAMCVKFQ